MRLLIIFLVMLFSFGPVIHAEEDQPSREQLQQQINILKDQISSPKRPQRDPELYGKYKETLEKEYDYNIKLMDLNIEILQTQRLQTYTVMSLVALVVLAGIAFSAYQLWKSIGLAGVQLTSDLELSARNVRITSSVVGVVVLVISVAFLYIYAHDVYQLRTVEPFSPAVEQPSG